MVIQTQEDPQSLPLIKAKAGDTVTLDCTVLNQQNINQVLYWYKQSLGYIRQIVASRSLKSTIDSLYKSRFTVGEGSNFYLTISNITKEDEANYVCDQGGQYLNIWKDGVFLTVKGKSYISLHILGFQYHDQNVFFSERTTKLFVHDNCFI